MLTQRCGHRDYSPVPVQHCQVGTGHIYTTRGLLRGLRSQVGTAVQAGGHGPSTPKGLLLVSGPTMTLLSSICSPGVPLACSRVWTTSSSLFSSSAGMQYLGCLETRAQQSLDKDPLPWEHARAPPCTLPQGTEPTQACKTAWGCGKGVAETREGMREEGRAPGTSDWHPTTQGHTAASAQRGPTAGKRAPLTQS